MSAPQTSMIHIASVPMHCHAVAAHADHETLRHIFSEEISLHRSVTIQPTLMLALSRSRYAFIISAFRTKATTCLVNVDKLENVQN